MFYNLNSEHPPGVIAGVSDCLGRYREYDQCVEKVVAPEGSEYHLFASRHNALNYNNAVRAVLKEDRFQWMWLLDDDMTFPDTLLMSLLDRNVPCVSPMMLKNRYPFGPNLHRGEKQGYRGVTLKETTEMCVSQIVTLAGTGSNLGGLIDAPARRLTFGTPGMLIRRKVLEELKDPWFEAGKTDPEKPRIDLYFCEKMRKAGICFFYDTDNPAGHTTHIQVWPTRSRKSGRFIAAYQGQNDFRVDLDF